jgi:hypothetical protein
MQSQILTHKGKEIFQVNYSKLGIEALKVEVAAVETEAMRRPLGSVLALVDMRGAVVSPEFNRITKESSVRIKPYIRKMAVLGMDSDARRTMLNIVMKVTGQSISMFNDVSQARDWLVS